MKKSAVVLSIILLTVSTHAASEPVWRVMSLQDMDLQVWHGGSMLFDFAGRFVGPKWARTNFDPGAAPNVDASGRRVYESPISFKGIKKAPVHFRMETAQKGANAVVVKHTCRTEEAQDIMGPSFFIFPNDFLSGGKAVAVLAGGGTKETELPPARMGNLGNDVKQLTLHAAQGDQIVMDFDPPCAVNSDKGQLRIWTMDGALPASQDKTAMTTITFPGTTRFRPENNIVDMSDWFELNVDQDFTSPSVIGLQDWLDAPAGKHGWVKIKDNEFVFEKTGQPVKFWGINIATTWVAPPEEGADQWADLCAKYGCNIVRFHKFARPTKIGKGGKGIMNNEDGMNIDPELAPNFDYFTAALAKRGVYTGWSHLYQYRPAPADKEILRAYDEIMAVKHGLGFLDETAYGLINFAPDVQDRVIQMTVNLLNRVNTVTGKRYAEDRSIAYIELQNEDDIFFGKMAGMLTQYPTYQKWWNERFSEWLEKKYGSQDALAEAWGQELKNNETLSARNIDGAANARHGAGKPTKRQLDTYVFMFHEQDTFYKRYKQAIRDTGYQGAICGSCWQAKNWLGHIFNVYSDREVGFIDRHNYYGGPPMLSSPGMGLLSAGMQQVSDRPYGLTEWHTGHQWDAEQIPLVTIYGNFVQGWDYLAFFASSSWHIQSGQGACNAFTKLCQYPAINMMMHRGDVKEGAPAAVRKVSVDGMFNEGWVGFEENFSLLGAANVKEFSGVVPKQSLAVGPVLLEYIDGPVPAEPVVNNTGPYIDDVKKIVKANTGELVWDYSSRGFFTLDTPNSQAVIGFAGPAKVLDETGAKTYDLSDVTIDMESPFACLYVSSLDKKKSIAQADRLLVTAVARGEYEGTVLDELSGKPVQRVNAKQYKGGPTPVNPGPEMPFLVEPVSATIALRRGGNCKVTALDHEGRLPEGARTVPVNKAGGKQTFHIGKEYRTVYYLVEF